ncbi:hypothetical protein K1T71_008393 [Dendrolimus kikuchii]|uniref:Uncharacterized protein n=1 Tax=Dendrolimus kikuchii TaxID=765133 RepID=A0ACC1CWW6_9NEOP|nr:hypothetical protein K1T71_008393 [Dendrolimus kikuchii]
MSTWSVKDTFKFIELYKEEEGIWNPNHIDYRDRIKIKEAWQRLEDAMSIPVKELKKRKETLMTLFRKRFKEKQLAIKLGRGDNFSTAWIFFDAMEEFLSDIYELRNISNPIDNVMLREDYDQAEYLEEECLTEEGSVDAPETEPIKRKRKSSKRKKSQNHIKQEDCENEYSYIEESSTSQNKNNDDDCELYGRLLAKKLRRFSQYDREELMYEIDGLLLKRNRSRNNPDSSQQDAFSQIKKCEEESDIE